MYLKIDDYILKNNYKEEQYVAFLSRRFPVMVEKRSGFNNIMRNKEANELVIKTIKTDLKYDLEKYRVKIENEHPKNIEDLRKEILLNNENNDILLSALERYLIIKDIIHVRSKNYIPMLNHIIKKDCLKSKDFINYSNQIKNNNKFKILNEYIVKYFEYIFD